MKKLLIVLIMLPLLSFADHGRHGAKNYFASMSISNASYVDYEVIINGERFNLRNDLFINRLRPGMQHVRIVAHRVNRRGYGFAEVVYNGELFLAHGEHLQARLNHRGQLDIFRARTNNFCRQSCVLRHHHNFRANDDCNRGRYDDDDDDDYRGRGYGRRR